MNYSEIVYHIMLISNMALNKEMAPKMMKSADVPFFSHFSGSRIRSFAPMRTATPVSRAKAKVIPTRTRVGDVSAANVMVMIWVLSPSSIRDMSEKQASRGKVLRLFCNLMVFFFLGNKGIMPNRIKTTPETANTSLMGRNDSKVPPMARLTPSTVRKASIAPAKTCDAL